MLDRVNEAWADCEKCSLARCGRTNVVVGAGPAPSPLMLIGEAPGEQEDKQGEPFVGPAGRLLRESCAAEGIDLALVYITNIVACRPPDNRIPMFDEVAACRPRLEQLVGIVKPKVIVVLGSVPLTPVTGKQGITKSRGKWTISRWRWRRDFVVVDVMPTFHPAGLLAGRLKSPDDIQLFRADLRAAYDRAFNGPG